MVYNPYQDQDSDTIKISKFNSAALINFRIDNLIKDTHKHSRQGDFLKWNVDLDRIWIELVGDSEEAEENKFNELNKKIATEGTLNISKETKGFKKAPEQTEEQRTKQYHLLMKKQAFLQKLLNKQGKGTAYWEDEDDWD